MAKQKMLKIRQIRGMVAKIPHLAKIVEES